MQRNTSKIKVCQSWVQINCQFKKAEHKYICLLSNFISNVIDPLLSSLDSHSKGNKIFSNVDKQDIQPLLNILISIQNVHIFHKQSFSRLKTLKTRDQSICIYYQSFADIYKAHFNEVFHSLTDISLILQSHYKLKQHCISFIEFHFICVLCFSKTFFLFRTLYRILIVTYDHCMQQIDCFCEYANSSNVSNAIHIKYELFYKKINKAMIRKFLFYILVFLFHLC